MSCGIGDKSCDTPRRRMAIAIFLLMVIVFLWLSVVSFIGSRGQVTPAEVRYGDFTAAQGKRVFQAYNCMGCHTIVGNGAYLGPDLTKEYDHVGPAWLEAFLPSAGGWPTEMAVSLQVNKAATAAGLKASDIDAYLDAFPGARDRIERRGGNPSHMPNLPFSADEIGQLIAFLRYTSELDTEGWPARIKTGSTEHRVTLLHGTVARAEAATAPAASDISSTANANENADQAAADDSSSGGSAVADGEQLAAKFGCTACHATDDTRKVGPGWGGLAGGTVQLADGSSVVADADYLTESILQPDAKVVKGYPAGVMPPYAGQLDDAEVAALVAYIQSLGTQEGQP